MYFYIKNLQGNICKIVDASGSVIANYTYDAWGKLLSVKDSAGNTITSSSNIALLNPMRYRGYVYDDETGLYYLQSRYYDPTIGRFLNADVLFDTESGSPLSTNMFAYCENDCINNVDNNGYTYYQYSYYRARAESKYLVTVTFYYSNSSVVVNFTVNRGFVSLSLANQSKKDKKFVYKNLNNYYAFSKLFTHGDTYLLAHAIYKITKRISKGYLKGRTMGGIHTELLIHYACYILGIRRSSTHQIDIGASLGNIGYDDNAWAFETAYFASLAWKAIRNGANFIGRYILRHIMYL